MRQVLKSTMFIKHNDVFVDAGGVLSLLEITG